MRLVPKSALVLTLGLGTVLAGCGGGGLIEQREGACPTATILADAENVTAFRPGPGRDLPDVHYQGAITHIDTGCDYGRSRGDRYAYAHVNLSFDVDLGSVAFPAPVDVPYFVAVIVPDTQTVLTKEVFMLTVPFDGTVRSVSLDDRIDSIAIPVVENTEGANYEIVIGFELNPEQVEHNRLGDR